MIADPGSLIPPNSGAWRPITVTASDPSRTVIRGQLKLWDADYWHLKSLRFQAGVRGGTRGEHGERQG